MPAGRILALSAGLSPPCAAIRREIDLAYVCTMAVMVAGWNEPVARSLRITYGDVPPPWSGADVIDAEAAALTWGTAAHALDYDDVHMTSATHPSAALIPAIEAAALVAPTSASMRAEAFAILGLAAFETANVVRPDVIDLARRVSLRETAVAAGSDVGIDRGNVTVSLVRDGRVTAAETVFHYPGSPTEPITEAQLDTKLKDCVDVGDAGPADLAERMRNAARHFAGAG